MAFFTWRSLIQIGLVSAAVSTAATTPAADLVLTDGRTLKAARIVTIGEQTANVVHAGGVENLPVDLVPLDVLARAHMQLKATAAEKHQRDEEAKRRAAERIAEQEKAKAEEIQLRLAAAQAREKALANRPTTPAAQRTPANSSPEAQLLALKAKFPRKQSESVVYYSDKRRMQPVSTTTRTIDRTASGYVSRSTTLVNTQIGRPDTTTIDVPHIDLWTDYRSRIQTATLQSLPITLTKLDEKLEDDLDRLRAQSNSIHSQVTAQQARLTIEWIDQKLRPYLAQLRTITR